MNIVLLRKTVAEAIALHPEDDYGFERCCKIMTEILTENMTETVDHLKNQCTDEEFFWIASVFDDVAEKTQSKDFVDAIRYRLAQVTRENYVTLNYPSRYSDVKDFAVSYDDYVKSVTVDLEYAEGAIKI